MNKSVTEDMNTDKLNDLFTTEDVPRAKKK